jgi:hypothetical protein
MRMPLTEHQSSKVSTSIKNKTVKQTSKRKIGVEVDVNYYVNPFLHIHCDFLSAAFAFASSAAIFAASFNSNLRAHSCPPCVTIQYKKKYIYYKKEKEPRCCWTTPKKREKKRHAVSRT